MTIRRALLLLIIAILIAAALNPPFATLFIKSRTDDKGIGLPAVFSPEAAAYGWPSETPHEHAWPLPTEWSESRAFGFRQILVWSRQEGRARCSMEYELIGWPVPVFERVQMWWPWDDPDWQTEAQSDPALRLYWPGVVLNPLIAGGGLWLVLVCPLVIWVNARRAMRRRRGWCVKCGYDLRGDLDSGCPECGWGRG